MSTSADAVAGEAGQNKSEVQPPAAPEPPVETSAKASTDWADENDDMSSFNEVDDVTKRLAKSLDMDVKGAPDLHSGELIVREAGCADGEHETQPVTSWAALNIDDAVKATIAKKGWATMSKIQQIAVPLILKDPPLNLIGQAQAGTGKTGTFVISMLSRISAKETPSSPQGIILCVSQELCTQIAQEVNFFGESKGIKARRIMSAGKRDMKGSGPAAPWALEQGEDFMEQVVVGTVGMVKNYLTNAEGRKKKKPMIDASLCQVLVLDEADQMIQAPPHGFGDDVAVIRNMILKKRKGKPCQVLLFSATFTEEMRQVACNFVGGPTNDRSKYHEITLSKKDMTLSKVVNFSLQIGDPNETSEENLYKQKFAAIPEIWSAVASSSIEGQSVIFCNRKERVQMLADFLRKEGYNVGQIHGDMQKSERDIVLAEFKRGERQALVSTNVTSRGIDNPNVTLVINVDLPVNRNNDPDPENFVHRIGRSGRWTKKGASVSLVARSSSPHIRDQANLKEIQRILFSNSDVDRPLIEVNDVTTLGEKIESQLLDIE